MPASPYIAHHIASPLNSRKLDLKQIDIWLLDDDFKFSYEIMFKWGKKGEKKKVFVLIEIKG